jgi:ubiquinone/menaquinone biosynthesis C-methylase UbiE
MSHNLNWDYSDLAQHYDSRPDYCRKVLHRLFVSIDLDTSSTVVDMGAGTGMLTRHLCNCGCSVIAVEPNPEMRKIAQAKEFAHHCEWKSTTAEASGLPNCSVNLVIFGSSFNVVDRSRALTESARLLKPGGWFACLWNHRDLTDPLQAEIENRIKSLLPDYTHGVRRDDQASVITRHSDFGPVQYLQGSFSKRVSVSDYLEAWRSHATLSRQAGDKMPKIIAAICEGLGERKYLDVPYHTKIWFSPVLNDG